MTKIKRSYKITSFLNASFSVDFKRNSGGKRANTFEIVCYVTTKKKVIPFSKIEDTIEKNIKPLSGQYLNDLPQFKSELFSTEVLAQYLAKKINQELKNISGRLNKIEVSEDPVRTVCLELQ